MSLFERLAFWRNEPKQNLLSLGIKAAAAEIAGAKLPKPSPPDATNWSLVKYGRNSELVYACVEKKAMAACDPVLTVEKRKSTSDEFERVDDHPLIELMNNPNPWESGDSFIKSWFASENLCDVFYAEIIRSAAKEPVNLIPLHPGNVKEHYRRGERGSTLRYIEYNLGDGKIIKLDPEDVLIRRRHSTASVFSSHSPLAAALGTADADAALNDYVRAFFNNGGVPSGVLKFTDRKLKDEQAKAIQQQWLTRYARSGTGRRGVAVLDSSAEFQTIGSELNDITSEELSGQSETRICMTFGVPPILIGAYVALRYVNQRASVQEAQTDFWKHTMKPELTSVRRYLTHSLLSEFESEADIRSGRIRVNWDFSNVEALQESQDDLMKRANEGFAGGLITRNEGRGMIGMDPVPEGDEFRSQAVSQPGANTETGDDDADDEEKSTYKFSIKDNEPYQPPFELVPMDSVPEDELWFISKDANGEPIKQVIKLNDADKP